MVLIYQAGGDRLGGEVRAVDRQVAVGLALEPGHGVGVEGAELRGQDGDAGQAVRGAGPVEREAGVEVAGVGEFGVGLWGGEL